jgi:hypothetical protein
MRQADGARRTVGGGPGVEGLKFDNRSLWAVFKAGSRKLASRPFLGVALEREDFGVWTTRSIIAMAVISSPKISPQALKGLFEVTIREARSYRAETRLNMRLAASGSNGM